MFEIIFVVLAVGLMAFIWWWLKRRRRELLGDSGEQPDGAPRPAEPQALTRDALMHRSREFDPSAWDDGPDSPAVTGKPASRPAPARPAPTRAAPVRPADDEDDAPAYFDREFLERQRRQRAIDNGTDIPPSD
ncbi:MAG: hypothetical protein KIT69_20490 [Propionibacteriaceae bacterium]|nr:hypothetical protein [Propionibacteriaceae bacterium]